MDENGLFFFREISMAPGHVKMNIHGRASPFNFNPQSQHIFPLLASNSRKF